MKLICFKQNKDCDSCTELCEDKCHDTVVRVCGSPKCTGLMIADYNDNPNGVAQCNKCGCASFAKQCPTALG